MNEFECVIGLEVHVELNTATKAFCRCKTDFGAAPNTQVCPVCLGHPGALPVFNGKVLEKAVKVGLALNCNISEKSRFDRKNYFYPDLPKAYQITQFYRPLCKDGYLTLETEMGEKRIGITRIHIEEDAGTLTHRGDKTKIDCNRCGVPLLEIVSEPQLRSAEEVKAYLKKLRSVILFTGCSDCKMNEGSMRCDINISVRRKGEKALGTRTEIKNLNSFKYAAKAVEYEFARQVNIIKNGGSIIQETVRFDAERGITEPMRSKEDARDYRYFPEPDLPEVYISRSRIEHIGQSLPTLPDERIKLYGEKFGISPVDGENLTQTPEKAEYFEGAAKLSRYPKIVSNMLLSDIPAVSGETGFEAIPAKHLASLADFFGDGEINSATVKRLLCRIAADGIDPCEVIDAENLRQINDEGVIEEYVLRAVNDTPKAVSDYKNGKKTAISAIIGRAMAESSGKLNPQKLKDVCLAVLDRLE
ncbi:MAG: Asp-tRNA(Asn)/Glu-tRNA(Gln) amidotransferase subunit GatB [Clostridia bacterium]|nr:Asp-tRNA(Asn)/Glu-tRNA(Gln) amidotransferase subunit GatB [Clostridia bacterium]